MLLPNTPYSQQWLTAIGVVADARYRELERARLEVYVSHLQAAIPLNSLMVGLTGVGLLLGVSTALAGGRMIDSLLYGVGARDPLTLTVAPLALVAAATLGCALPAARATRVNPAIVLRDE